MFPFRQNIGETSQLGKQGSVTFFAFQKPNNSVETDAPKSAAPVSFDVIAPREAWRILQGESSCRVRASNMRQIDSFVSCRRAADAVIREGLTATGLFQSGKLQGGVLVVGADAGHSH